MKNGLVTIDQTMVIDFTGSNIHGPIVVLPQSYDTTWTIKGENIQRSYYFPVRNITVYDRPYKTESGDNDNFLIYIGDENQTVSGIQNYHFSYTIQLRDFDLNGLQAFYMNIVGTGWQDPIGVVNFSISPCLRLGLLIPSSMPDPKGQTPKSTSIRSSAMATEPFPDHMIWE